VLRPQITRTRELIAGGRSGEVSWAICGCAFGRYHEQEEPERMAGFGRRDRSLLVLQEAGRRAALRHDGLRAPRAHEVSRPAKRVTALSGMVLPSASFGGRSIAAEMDDNTVALLDFGDGPSRSRTAPRAEP